VFRYEFNHVWSIPSAWGPTYAFCGTHVCHGAELPFMFNSASYVGYNFTSAEIALSLEMSTMWGSFVQSGVPAAPSAPSWPLHSTAANMLMLFMSNQTVPQLDSRAALCDFWDEYGYTQK
jgi:carboxylesterase type B